MPPRDIPNTLEISTYLHCRLCHEELRRRGGSSMQQFARLEVGYTKLGLQIWCLRHNINVIHLDFAGKGPFYASF